MARIVDRQEKREALLRAAAETFAERGFAHCRISDIAVTAGVGKGTMYEYFDSKEELFFAVFEWVNAEIADRIDHHLKGDGEARRQLERLFVESADVVGDMQTMYSLNLDFWAACRGSSFEGRFKQAVEGLYVSYRDLVAAVIKRGQESGEFRPEIDAEALAAIFVGAFDGLGIQYWIDQKLDLHRCTSAFFETLIHGMAAPEPNTTSSNG